jgi:hypothetical protein
MGRRDSISRKFTIDGLLGRHDHGRMIHYYFNINVAFFDFKSKKQFFC